MTETGSRITLRPALLDDAEMIFRWRNDPFIIERSSSHSPVTWQEHSRWFGQTVAAENRRIMIILANSEPIGQIRFDRVSDSDCVISVYLLREFTGKGWGIAALRLGCSAIFKDWNAKRVIACVRTDNKAAHSAFLKIGFRELSEGASCPPDHHAMFLTSPKNDS